MSRPIDSFDAAADARRGAAHLRSLMARESSRITPGQWGLAEDLFDRVYKCLVTGKHYAVADNLKEPA